MSLQETLNKARSESDLRIRSEILTYALRDDPNREGAELLLRDLGETHRQLGDLDAALFYLEQAWDKDPESPDILISLGAVYSAQKRFDQALQLYSRAYEVEGRAHILVLMADTLQSLERLKEAEVYVRTALRLQEDKDIPYAQYVLGKILCGLEKYQEALNAFENAAKAESLKTVPQWIAFARSKIESQTGT
ncbi:MAG: tetratricopeptide repeat protein [Candidatus Heimdallarchaeota archaeon]